jgi:hypothetical protein
MKVQIGNKFKNSESSHKHEFVAPKKNSLLSSLIENNNVAFTDNGAKTLKSSLNSLVDLFSMGGALRNRNEKEVIQLFIKAFSEDGLLALKLLFYIRDVRGGLGERKTFKTILAWLGDNYPEVVEKNIYLIAEYGRFDDYLVLLNTKSKDIFINFINFQLEQDVVNYENDKPVSLLAKWLKSENTSSLESRKIATQIRKSLGWTPKQYRKTLSVLREYLKVVEVKMSKNAWQDIDFSQVPSKASLQYRKAFAKHVPEKYSEFISDVKSGKSKINASALFPYEIYEKASNHAESSETLDVLWDSLPDYFDGNNRNILPVVDVSLSMMSGVPYGRPMSMAVSLGIYIAERNKGIFKDYFITYSETPTLQKVTGNNIREKIACLESQRHVNTNIQAVFDLVLEQAIKNNVSQEEMPEQLVIISDMEWDAPQNKGKTNHETIKAKYNHFGYDLPNLVYWNVNSKKNNVPTTHDEKGVILVSGASPSVFKSLLSGKECSPLTQMLEILNNSRYNLVTI